MRREGGEGMSGYTTDHISDPRYLGTLDEPQEGFIWADKAMCCPEGTELWHNGESLFSLHFRWCHVTKKENTN